MALCWITLAETPGSRSQVAKKIDQMAYREPPALAAEVRIQAADAVRNADPELAAWLVDKVLSTAVSPDYPPLLHLLLMYDKPAAIRFFKRIPFSSSATGWNAGLRLRCILEIANVDSELASAATRSLTIPEKETEYRRAADALKQGITPDSLKLAREILSRKSAPSPAPPDPNAQKIAGSLKQLRGDLSKADRAKLAESFASGIRALPDPQTRLGLATALSSYATEGDLGPSALQAVTDTLGLAIRDAKPLLDGSQYLYLAKLVRYEHMKSPIEDPSLDSRLELLHLRELDAEQAPLTLTSIDGKTYSLKTLRGKVVIVNFWATWCPPCRKEMPDLEAISRKFASRGLIVLAISDEPADTVKPFIAKQGYTLPVLLDPDRKAHTAFHVEGIPKTFVFGRDGKLAAHAIDMRTNAQFLALLKHAGLD